MIPLQKPPVMLLISRFIVILSEAKDLLPLDPSLSLRMTPKIIAVT